MSKLYAKTHESATVEGSIATVSISEHAIKELGDLVYVELPEIGQIVSAGDNVVVVESVKAASDVYSPVSGEILSVNTEAVDDPSVLNDLDDTENDWLYTIKMSDTSECDSLLSEEDYQTLIG